MASKKYNPQWLEKESAEWKKLREQIASEELDPQTIFDTLDGETGLIEGAEAVSRMIFENELQVEGIKAMVKQLTDRKTRIENSTEHLRGILLMAMETADKETLKLDSMTISMRQNKPGLVIDDEAQIPADYFVPQPPKLDKAAVKAALNEDGAEPIPGAHLDNGSISLSIRMK